MKALLLSFLTFTMSVTPSQFPTINLADLDGTETIWVQKNGVDYKLSLDNIKQYGGCDVYCTELNLSSAQLLTGNSTPVLAISAPGSGKIIEVISATFVLTFNSTAYATNLSVSLYNNSAGSVRQAIITSILGATSTAYAKFDLPQGNANSNMYENEALYFRVETGNPTLGDSNAKVYIHYRIITL